MAKTYTFNTATELITVNGGTSTDVMTFKDITDYFEANPLLNEWNKPRLYGGVPYILGDSNTFTGVAGDTIKVVYEGTTYDDIAIGTATSIANVVTAINNALPGSPASADATTGFLKIQCLNNVDGSQVIGDVSIADGTSTGATCVARLFSVAGRRDSSVFDFPYELTEGNASNWFGLGGMGTPADDTTDFSKGYSSVSGTVSSIPTGTAITSINATGGYVIVYMANTSGFALHDEVMISGSTNFDGVIFRVTSISTNTYVYGYKPRYCPSVSETPVGATLIKPLAMVWNNTYSVPISSINGISICDKIKFSAKSDGAGTPKITSVIVRNYYGSGSPDGFYFGAYSKPDLTLTSAWQDFEIDIRSMANYGPISNGGYRGYWNGFSKLYFFFDGLSVGEKVWLDGVRFTCEDRNPVRTAEQNFVFPSGLYITAGCWFKDYGFNVRFDTLDTQSKISNYTFYAYSNNLGEVQFGDYSGTEKEGGTFIFNYFCDEDSGGTFFSKVQCQSIAFVGPKDTYGGYGFASGNVTNNYRNCTWTNMLNFFSNEIGSTFENCAMSGYRYFFAFPQSGVSINGFTVYGAARTPFYIRTQSSIVAMKGIKIIDARNSRQIGGCDTYGSYSTRYGLRLVNFDISECGTGHYITITNNVIHDITRSPINYIAFSFNLTVKDEAGAAISGATVTMLDKNGTTLFTETTSATGTITEQYVDVLTCQNDAASGVVTFNFDTPTVNWSYKYPFTLMITKSGYEKYTSVLLSGGYSRTDEIIKKGANLTVALKLDTYGATTIIDSTLIDTVLY